MSKGILNTQIPGSILGLKGLTPDQRAGAKQDSTLHYESSLNNRPQINKAPSGLDLNGATPEKYLDNLPE